MKHRSKNAGGLTPMDAASEPTQRLRPLSQPKDDSGTSVLEASLLTPVLLVLLLGVIEIGRYAALSIQVANAARAGAQYGAQNLVTASDGPGMKSAALADGQNVPGLTANACACYTNSSTSSPNVPLCSTCPGSSGVYVQVNTHAIFQPIFTFGIDPGKSITVNGVAQMQVAE